MLERLFIQLLILVHNFNGIFTKGSPIRENSIYFAVKTWSGFHSTRAQAVKKTWGKHVTHLQFFSDKADQRLPSIDIGVPNTKTGHCQKTITILQQVVKIIETLLNIKWIFLADDDTILGVQRLCEVLSCYCGGDDDTIISERYGYGYGKKFTPGKGYDYPTGGAGVVLSVSEARALAQCVCAGASQSDDMALGACARVNRLAITHSPLIHQVVSGAGYDYPTGGAGVVLSVSTARTLAQCVCAGASQPDDMALGACARVNRLAITLTIVPPGYDYPTGGAGVVLSVSTARTLAQCVCAGASQPDDMALGACARVNRLAITLTIVPPGTTSGLPSGGVGPGSPRLLPSPVVPARPRLRDVVPASLPHAYQGPQGRTTYDVVMRNLPSKRGSWGQ